MNSSEKLRLALGDSIKRTIGGQEFEFEPLDVTYLGDIWAVAKKVQSNPDNLSKEDVKSMLDVLVAFVKNTFPEGTDETLIRKFCGKYFVELQNVMLEIHSSTTVVDDSNQKNINTLRQRFQNAKPAGSNQEQNQPQL